MYGIKKFYCWSDHCLLHYSYNCHNLDSMDKFFSLICLSERSRLYQLKYASNMCERAKRAIASDNASDRNVKFCYVYKYYQFNSYLQGRGFYTARSQEPSLNFCAPASDHLKLKYFYMVMIILVSFCWWLPLSLYLYK